jgi:protein arginine N-methyltransferase 1
VALEPSELFPEVPNLYEFPSVHADMIFDRERVGKYWKAISTVVRPGCVVADIGTGTGILAFLALRAGASHVHAIERSLAIDWARRVAAGLPPKLVPGIMTVLR